MTPRGARRRFYYAGRVPSGGQDEPRVELSPEESRHLRLVLRLGRGDAVELFDADGRGFLAEVEEPSERGAARLRIVRALEDATQAARDAGATNAGAAAEGAAGAAPAAGLAINLAVAMLKRRAMDLMIEKLSELGVGVLQPLLTRRCIALGDVKPGQPPPDRWERLAIAAAKQSGRNRPLRALAPMRLRDWLEQERGAWRNAAFGHLAPAAPTLGAWLRGIKKSDDANAGDAGSTSGAPTPIWLAIGPEGGWTDEEAEALTQAGFAPVNLGDLTLRAETAAIAVAAACRLL
jgi:16S rRNA (uracil1498-N3)-methyltransferase